MPSFGSHDQFPPPEGATRRAVVVGVPSAAALAALGLTAAPAAPAAAAPSDDYIAQAFKALAAYVVPGNDEYSAQQRLTMPRPGGVAAGADIMLEESYDKAISIALAPGLDINAPGALGAALLLEIFTTGRYPQTPATPFAHRFANLTHANKALVLADIDNEQLIEDSALGYAFGTLITLAAFACYGERGVYDPATRILRRRPIGWDLAQYDGVSNGWPEFHGYWEGRTSVPDVPSATSGQVRHA